MTSSDAWTAPHETSRRRTRTPVITTPRPPLADVSGGLGVKVLGPVLVLITPCGVAATVCRVTTPSPAPGWYPDPSDPGKRIYWDGTAWSTPAPSEADKSNSGKKAAVAIGVCVLVVIGLVMSMQSISLLTGSGPVWTGVAVVAAGTAFFLRAAKWVRV